jgi:hypothetical protein
MTTSKGEADPPLSHPSDKDLSLGTPERKKPLGLVLPVYSNSENAI